MAIAAIRSAQNLELAVSEFADLLATAPRATVWRWPDLVARLNSFSERSQKDGPGWSPTVYADGASRGNEGVTGVTAAVVDIDGNEPDWELMDGLEYVAHTTYSHAEDAPHWRVVLPLQSPVPAAEWASAWRKIQFWIAPSADEACKDRARFYWWPTCRPGSPRGFIHHEGAVLNVGALRSVPRLDAPPTDIVDQAPRPRLHALPDNERPGDRFTREADWADILLPAGWRLLSTHGAERRWRRPENGVPKTAPGCSATTGGGGHDVLYVFSSNAAPFTPNTSYTKFRVLALLEHGGDNAAAASALSARYWGTGTAYLDMGAAGRVSANGAGDDVPGVPGEPSPGLVLVSGEDFALSSLPPIPWVVGVPPAGPDAPLADGGLLAPLETAILGAESGAGKTWVVHEFIIACVTGTPLFGHFPIPNPQRVLLIDEESSLWLLRQRFSALLKGRGLDPERFVREYWERIAISIDQGFSFDNQKLLDALYVTADTHRPDWSIFETLIRVHRRSENDNSAMAGLFEERIKPYKRTVESGVLIPHHVRKSSKEAPNDPGSMLRGASDLKGQLDEFWFLRGKSGNPRSIFEHDKCRLRPELPSFTLVRERDVDGGVRLVVASGVSETVADQNAEVIMRFLVDNGRQSRGEILDFGKGRAMSERTVVRALTELVDAEQVDRVKVGKETFYWPIEVDLQ